MSNCVTMAPRKKNNPPATTKTPRRSTRHAKSVGNGIPDIYQDMLAEATLNAPDDSQSSPRPSKRRKLTPVEQQETDDLFEENAPPTARAVTDDHGNSAPLTTRAQQTVYDDFEESEESDAEFEDVDLELAAQSDSDGDVSSREPLQIDLTKSALETPKRMIQRRKPLSKAERMVRLDVHKWHLMSLIGHGLHRNSWCNDETIHSILKPLVSRKTVKLFHFEESEPMYRRNHSFNKAVEDVCAMWRREWKINVLGLRRPRWREDVDARDEVDEGEDLDFEDFQNAAHTRRGSRDLGAQLFTALLRSIAVDARLVFSLQVLPFSGAAKIETPSRLEKHSQYIRAPAQNYGSASSFSSPFAPPSRPKKQTKIVDSPYPIFWTEILTPTQTWIPLDPLVRNSISKPKTQFEPPLSDTLNSMTYVIAYEDDNSFRDVTRRYAQWFNAKTRRLRVEATKNGEEWYASVLTRWGKKLREPRDEIEDDELTRKANTEGMPQNVQDFKNHPVYVLERHLRRNEVLQPRREVGKMNVGTAKNGKIESVYRRQDVHLCRTADAWYRRGRDIRTGEQPLKVMQSKSRQNESMPGPDGDDEEEDGGTEGVGLYAEYQTNIYEPPPVENGLIPKNVYGNLDVYVPSMIPAGAVHFSHNLAASAARVLGIDYTDAVVGFDFKGRQGTAVVNGVVVAESYTAAIAMTIKGLEALGSEEVQLARSRIILDTWKRMLQSLRVRERIEAEYGSTETRNNKDTRSDDGDDNDDDDDQAYEDDEIDGDFGGGFMPDDDPTEEKVQEQAVSLQTLKARMPNILPDEVVTVPIKITRSPHKLLTPVHELTKNKTPDPSEIDDLFDDDDQPPIADPEANAGGFLPEDTTVLDSEPGGSGGNGGGGFFIDDEPPTSNPSRPDTNDDNDDGGGNGFFAPETQPPSTSTREDPALQLAIANSLADSPPVAPDAATDLPPKSSAENTTSLSPTQSLLSHDPSADDDEPEWLNEAFDG